MNVLRVANKKHHLRQSICAHYDDVEDIRCVGYYINTDRQWAQLNMHV